MASGAAANLFEAAERCLACAEPAAKLALTWATAAAILSGELAAVETAAADGHGCPSAASAGRAGAASPIGIPGRPARPLLVPQRQLAQRGLGSAQGRAALVHAVAHIEFNAINLAWDAVYRFRGMPAAYYRDWAQVAADEARHFALLDARLAELGHAYGDFDAHDGLWDMATRTAHSCLERMALVPRVLEARGLDVTPGMIVRLRRVGDDATVTILETILGEEVAHVAAGSRWFAWCCARAGIEPQATFQSLLETYMHGALRGPFNVEARLRAGFSAAELAHLDELAA